MLVGFSMSLTIVAVTMKWSLNPGNTLYMLVDKVLFVNTYPIKGVTMVVCLFTNELA